MLLLIVQYLLGLWANVYAPAQFAPFDSYPPFPSPALEFHILTGDALFLLSLVVLVFAALSKRLHQIAPAVVLVVSIFIAGQFGMAFVNSSPNDPLDSFGMGVMFLVAFVSAVTLMVLPGRRAPTVPAASPSDAAPTSAS